MNPLLDKKIVLVLNRNWQAIQTASPAEAFCQMATNTATGLDVLGKEHMVPTQWEDWLALPIRESDQAVHTVSGPIRIPTVIVLANYAKVPIKRPRFGYHGIRERDGGVCQYTGKELKPDEGNIDHVIPQARGGPTTWDNCVLSSKLVNNRKGCRTPKEAGLQLLKKPVAPRARPVTALLRNVYAIDDWNPFLAKI